MKKEDINYELISKIEIKISDTLFYIPEETIKGSILINPMYQMKIKDKILHLSLKIMQYEFWEYSNVQIKELKNIHITKIQEENIKYELKSEEINQSQIFQSFSLIEKENKIISIPFQITIKSENILPTFQFENKDYILGIRHLLLVECKEYNSSNYIGLFIGKAKNRELCSKKGIKENYKVGLDSLEVIANFEKLSYNFDEQLDFEIKTNTNLHFQKIAKMKQDFYRKIEWIGYMKNSILSKDILDSEELKYNANEYGWFSRLTMPLTPIMGAVAFGAIGGLGGIVGGALMGSGNDDFDLNKMMNEINNNINNNDNNENIYLSNVLNVITEPQDNNDKHITKENDRLNDISNNNSDPNKINESNKIINPDSNDNDYPNKIKDNSELNEINETNNIANSEPDEMSIVIQDHSNSNKINEFNNTINDNPEQNKINVQEKSDNIDKNNKISIFGGIIGGIFGGALGTSFGALAGFALGIAKQYYVMKDILNLNDNQNNIINNFSPKLSKPDYEKIIIDSLNKFVYFNNNNKVVGFIKFAYNIIPPMNGYYFKCNYNIKIKVEIEGIILNSKKYLKTQVDLYDSEEYISKMKKIFQTEMK